MDTILTGEASERTQVAITFDDGFAAAFSFIPGYWNSSSNRYRLGRDGLDTAAPRWLWRAWLNGSYDALYRARSRLVR